MTVDFRCEKCGKLLSVDAAEGSSVRCPHCNKKVQVPAALAALPRPQVPPGSPPPLTQPPGGEQGAGDEEEIVLEVKVFRRQRSTGQLRRHNGGSLQRGEIPGWEMVRTGA